jgi:hypothetical protein
MIIAKRRSACLLLLLLALAATDAFAEDRIDVSNTQEILITSERAAEKYRGRQKGDEALLIRDRSEIAKLVALFDKNVQGRVHACGYHWRITFYRGNLGPTEIFFNEECEKFERNTEQICEIVQAKFHETVVRPNAYVTNLDIDVKQLPELARQVLTNHGLRLVPLREVRRYPSVELRASSRSVIPTDRSLWDKEKANVMLDADRALVNDISRIRASYNVIKIGDLMHGMSSFGGGEIVEERRVQLYFEVGASLENVGKMLNKSRVGSTVIPETYGLQVVTDHRLTRPEELELKKNFPFVKQVVPF